VRLAIDDFGTGYSSLNYLRDFEVDTIRWDQSFVRALAENPATQAIVRSITVLARALDLSVTAEGIETAEQLELVRRAGCERGQGYHFAPAEISSTAPASFQRRRPSLSRFVAYRPGPHGSRCRWWRC
jgi:EAL domain-containing protein (putative c-di-GMP-specific phosphodiesterase class I)